MEEGRSLQEITDELETEVTKIIERRPAMEQPKNWLHSYVQKKQMSYTDTALQAVKAICEQVPQIVESYVSSQSKVSFAISNAGMLASIKSNLDALDPKTWAPKVVDEDSKQLAQAFCKFAEAIMEHPDTSLSFLEKSTDKQIDYELVRSLPKKPAPGTIYFKKSDKETIEYCYVRESNPKIIESGKISENRLGSHQSQYSSKDYFEANKRVSQHKDSKSIGELLYLDSNYYQHNQRTGALVQLDGMRSAAKAEIRAYDKTTQPATHGSGNK